MNDKNFDIESGSNDLYFSPIEVIRMGKEISFMTLALIGKYMSAFDFNKLSIIDISPKSDFRKNALNVGDIRWIKNQIQSLEEKGVLFKTNSKYIYEVNPNIVMKGDTKYLKYLQSKFYFDESKKMWCKF